MYATDHGSTDVSRSWLLRVVGDGHGRVMDRKGLGNCRDINVDALGLALPFEPSNYARPSFLRHSRLTR